MIALAFLKTMRPHQWTKNLVVLAAIIFAQRLTETPLLLRAIGGFGIFCALSGSVYVLNDLKDKHKDRLHPTKRKRPIASGTLPTSVAVVGLVLVAGAALAAATQLGRGFVGVAIAFLALNLTYSFILRRMMLLDVMAIATGFVMRALAGTELLLGAGESVRISPWLLMCTFFLSLFLALGKRRHELEGVDHEHRRSLEHYSVELVDRLTAITVAVTILSYSIYTIWPDTVAYFGTDKLLYTIPFVFYGLGRYLYLVLEKDGGGDPSEMLLNDRSILLTVLLWILAVTWIIYRV
jgi:4-hydroxybenzoate polyprenyltransferase